MSCHADGDQHEPTSSPCPDSGESAELPRAELGAELREAARQGLFLRAHSAIVSMEHQDALDVDVPDGNGETALTLAAAHGNARVVSLLLAKDADDMRCPDEDTPIPLVRIRSSDLGIRAAACGHADCVSLLRHRNPEISQHLLSAAYESGPLKGHTALSIAAMNGHHRVVADLLTEEPTADVHSGPYHGAALLLAAERGHGHVVDALLTHGCSPECHVATGGKSAMRLAIETQQWLVCALLIAYGAGLEDCREPTHLLETMACAVFLELDDALDVLLDHCEDHDVSRNATLGQGCTLVTAAVACGNMPALRTLLARGASASQPDALGNTALSIAVALGLCDAVKLLLQHGADPDTASGAHGEMPLQIAVHLWFMSARDAGMRHGLGVSGCFVDGGDTSGRVSVETAPSSVTSSRPEVNGAVPSALSMDDSDSSSQLAAWSPPKRHVFVVPSDFEPASDDELSTALRRAPVMVRDESLLAPQVRSIAAMHGSALCAASGMSDSGDGVAAQQQPSCFARRPRGRVVHVAGKGSDSEGAGHAGGGWTCGLHDAVRHARRRWQRRRSVPEMPNSLMASAESACATKLRAKRRSDPAHEHAQHGCLRGLWGGPRGSGRQSCGSSGSRPQPLLVSSDLEMSLSLKPASTSSAATPPRHATVFRGNSGTLVHNAAYSIELDPHSGAQPVTVQRVLPSTNSKYDVDVPITLSPPRPIRPPTPVPRAAPSDSPPAPEAGDIAESVQLDRGVSSPSIDLAPPGGPSPSPPLPAPPQRAETYAAYGFAAPRLSPADMDSGEIADNEADDGSSGLLASRDEPLHAAAAAAAAAVHDEVEGARALLKQPALRSHPVPQATPTPQGSDTDPAMGTPASNLSSPPLSPLILSPNGTTDQRAAGSPVTGLGAEASASSPNRPLNPEMSLEGTQSEVGSTLASTTLLGYGPPAGGDTTNSLRLGCMPARAESAASTLASTTLLGAGPPAITSVAAASAPGGPRAPASDDAAPCAAAARSPLERADSDMSIDKDLRANESDLAALDGCAKARRLVGESPAAEEGSAEVARSLEVTRSLDVTRSLEPSAAHPVLRGAPHWLQPGTPLPRSRSGSLLTSPSEVQMSAWGHSAKPGLRFRIDGDMGLVGCVRALFVASREPYQVVGQPMCSVLRRHGVLDNLPAAYAAKRGSSARFSSAMRACVERQ